MPEDECMNGWYTGRKLTPEQRLKLEQVEMSIKLGHQPTGGAKSSSPDSQSPDKSGKKAAHRRPATPAKKK